MRGKVILLLLLILLSLGQPAFAAEYVTLNCTASAPDENGCFDISVVIEDGIDLAMIQFTMIYDSAVLQCIGAESGSLILDNEAPTINTEQNGKIVYVWDSLTPLQSNGELMILHMKRTAEGITNVEFNLEEDFIFAYEDFSEATTIAHGCQVGTEPESTPGSEAGEPASTTSPQSPELDKSGPNILWYICPGVILLLLLLLFIGRKKQTGKHSA